MPDTLLDTLAAQETTREATERRLLPLPPLTVGEVAVLRGAAVITREELSPHGLTPEERVALARNMRALETAIEKIDAAQLRVLGPDAPGLRLVDTPHTHGPWLVDTDDPAVITDDMGVPVARVVLVGDFPGADGDAGDDIREGIAREMEANRALIAAAPDLVRALDAIVQQARNNFNRPPSERLPLIQELAEAALTQAKEAL